MAALLWLWRRPVATAPIRPLAWESPYAPGAAQEMAKRPNLWTFSPLYNKYSARDSNSPVELVKIALLGVPVVAQWLTNPTRNHEVSGLIPGLAQWVEDPVLV